MNLASLCMSKLDLMRMMLEAQRRLLRKEIDQEHDLVAFLGDSANLLTNLNRKLSDVKKRLWLGDRMLSLETNPIQESSHKSRKYFPHMPSNKNKPAPLTETKPPKLLQPEFYSSFLRGFSQRSQESKNSTNSNTGNHSKKISVSRFLEKPSEILRSKATLLMSYEPIKKREKNQPNPLDGRKESIDQTIRSSRLCFTRIFG